MDPHNGLLGLAYMHTYTHICKINHKDNLIAIGTGTTGYNPWLTVLL